MKGCGGKCHCACGTNDMVNKEQCSTPVGGIILDGAGRCPCGKELKDCCHKDVVIKSAPNEALNELCDPVDGKESPCGDEEKSA